MLLQRAKLFLAVLPAAAFAFAPAARAVIVDGANGTGTANTTIASYPVAGMNNVGTIAGGSGVYLGNGWVICAYHEGTTGFGTAGAKPFVFPDGSSYNNDGTYDQLTTPSDSLAADLVMVHLSTSPALLAHPSLTITSSSPSIGTSIYDIGNGQTRGTATTYNGNGGWTETGPQVTRWGQNTTANVDTIQPSGSVGSGTLVNVNDTFGTTTMFVSQFEANTNANNTTEISTGDSGGGVFSTGNTLLGINLVSFANDSNQPGATAIYGNDSGYADLASYRSQIQTIINSPEPGTLGLLAACMGGILFRRRRRSMIAVR